MTQPDMPSVMQAAKRLRRLIAEENAGTADCDTLDDIYGNLKDVDAFTDARTLADFALSVLPSDERPVAMEKSAKWDEVQTGWTCNEFRDYQPVFQQWRRCGGHGRYYRSSDLTAGGSRSGGPLFETEADAWLELEWRYYDQWWRAKAQTAREGLAAASRASGTDQR